MQEKLEKKLVFYEFVYNYKCWSALIASYHQRRTRPSRLLSVYCGVHVKSPSCHSIRIFIYMVATPPLWRDLVKISQIKLWHTSSFLLERTDFKNAIFEKIHWAQGRQGRWGQTALKPKTTKILNQNLSKLDEIQNFASATSKMTSWPKRPRKGLSDFFQKSHF